MLPAKKFSDPVGETAACEYREYLDFEPLVIVQASVQCRLVGFTRQRMIRPKG